MSHKIRFAVIGTSGIAHNHIDILKECSKAEVVSIYSRDNKRSKEFANSYGLTPVKSYKEILNDENIDAVDIVTEPSRHAELALKAIKHEKHVLIEKPLDINIEMAEKVMNEASRSPKTTSVISQKRFDPTIRMMKKELENGSIGKPYLTEVKLLWKRQNKYYCQGNGWRGKEGNVLVNQAIHWIDVAIWFYGKPTRVHSLTTRVKETITCYDTAICCLEFNDKILFNLVCSTAVQESQPEEFRIYGTRGMLDINKLKIVDKIKRLPLLKNLISALNPIYSPLQLQINSFVDSIINNTPPVVSVEDAYTAVEIVKACERVMDNY